MFEPKWCEIAQKFCYCEQRCEDVRAALPPGFDGIYRCKKHPERDAVAPIACRRCAECNSAALRNYAEQHEFKPTYRFQDERSTDDRSIYGEMIGHYKRKENII